MTAELTALALAGLVQAGQFVLFATPANVELTPAYTSSPRNGPPPRPLSKRTARLQRALNNHFEGLILFTLAVVVVTMGQQSTGVTQTAAWVYLVARIAYIPAYVFGWSPWRSVIWAAGYVATLTLLIAALI